MANRDATVHPVDGFLALMRPRVVPWGFDLHPATGRRAEVAHPPDFGVVARRRTFGHIHRSIRDDLGILRTCGIELHDAVAADDAAALAQSAHKVALNQDCGAGGQTDQSQARIFRGQAAFYPVGGPLDGAQYPLDLRLVEQEQRQADVV